MKWKYYPIPASDSRARQHVLGTMEIAAQQHTLPKKLLSRFKMAEGPIFAIAMEGLEVDRITEYRFAQFHFGRGFQEMAQSGDVPIDSVPEDGLRAYLFDYLCSSTQSLAIIDDQSANSDWWQLPEVGAEYRVESKRAFFNDEVMFFLLPVGDKCDLDDDTIRTANGLWSIGLCVDDISLPQGDTWSSEFLDEVSEKTSRIFVSAFDQEGYLIWEPQ